jgi:SAM-dependent methyltransferase
MPVPTNVISLPKNVSALPWTGERFVPGVVGQVEMEHLHRYIAAMQLCHNKEILDIASGEGYGCFMLAQVAKCVIGIDIDPASVQIANEKYVSEKINFKVGTCSAIPLADNSVDVVISFETIEHIKEQMQFVQEVKRVLRPEGIFIVSTPDRVVATPLGSPANEFHIRELYRDEFYCMLKKHYNNVVFFGQRSITGSLIFPDGSNISEKQNENLFFATGNTYGSIDCLEFFPRPQNIIAIATNSATEISFASSIYEGIFGTLDSLYAEHGRLSASHTELQERHKSLTSEFETLQEKYQSLHKQIMQQPTLLDSLMKLYKWVTAVKLRRKIKSFFN